MITAYGKRQSEPTAAVPLNVRLPAEVLSAGKSEKNYHPPWKKLGEGDAESIAYLFQGRHRGNHIFPVPG